MGRKDKGAATAETVDIGEWNEAIAAVQKSIQEIWVVKALLKLKDEGKEKEKCQQLKAMVQQGNFVGAGGDCKPWSGDEGFFGAFEPPKNPAARPPSNVIHYACNYVNVVFITLMLGVLRHHHFLGWFGLALLGMIALFLALGPQACNAAIDPAVAHLSVHIPGLTADKLRMWLAVGGQLCCLVSAIVGSGWLAMVLAFAIVGGHAYMRKRSRGQLAAEKLKGAVVAADTAGAVGAAVDAVKAAAAGFVKND